MERDERQIPRVEPRAFFQITTDSPLLTSDNQSTRANRTPISTVQEPQQTLEPKGCFQATTTTPSFVFEEQGTRGSRTSMAVTSLTPLAIENTSGMSSSGSSVVLNLTLPTPVQPTPSDVVRSSTTSTDDNLHLQPCTSSHHSNESDLATPGSPGKLATSLKRQRVIRRESAAISVHSLHKSMSPSRTSGETRRSSVDSAPRPVSPDEFVAVDSNPHPTKGWHHQSKDSLDTPPQSRLGGSNGGSSRSSSGSDVLSVETRSSFQKIHKTRSIHNLVSAGLIGSLHISPPPTSLGVILRVQNQTGYALRMAQWPTRSKRRGKSAYTLSCFRGGCFDEGSLPAPGGTLTDPATVIAIIEKPSLSKAIQSRKSIVGWVFFDLIKPNGYVLHLQSYVKLDRSGEVKKALLGKFDLDSWREKPMPSGIVGSVEVQHSTAGASGVTFCLESKDVEDLENHVDDTPLRPLIGLPTKGLTIFSYVSHPLVTISFRAGKDGRYHEGQPSSSGKVIYFARSDHVLGGVEGLSTMICVQHRHSPQPILLRSVSINPLSGLVTERDKSQPLASTADTKSIFVPSLNLSVSYGFHDSRMGKRHSLYAYATQDHSSWLGDLINENDRWLDTPFSRLVLQGSHDAGMFTPLHEGFVQMITKMKLDSDIGNFLIDHGISFVHGLTRLLKTFNINLDHAICNIANTQKDTIYDQLRLGARFFDYRPGYCFHDCVRGERGEIHHQHACVPGYGYVDALTEVFSFLALHPQEIVVFELKSDGFIARKTTWRKDSIPFHSMIPTRIALASAIEEARLISSRVHPQVNTIKIGTALDLDRKIGDLIQAGIRFIIIHRMGDEPEIGWDWIRDDSYDHNLYDSDRPDGILKALSRTHARNSVPIDSSILPPGKPLPGTIYQLQATPTKSITDDIVTSLTYSKASSLLVYTKASLDPETYAWIRQRHFIEPGTVVLLNDFVDSVLTEHAIEKSKIRAGFF